jgi:hypothetical protein
VNRRIYRDRVRGAHRHRIIHQHTDVLTESHRNTANLMVVPDDMIELRVAMSGTSTVCAFGLRTLHPYLVPWIGSSDQFSALSPSERPIQSRRTSKKVPVLFDS